MADVGPEMDRLYIGTGTKNGPNGGDIQNVLREEHRRLEQMFLGGLFQS